MMNYACVKPTVTDMNPFDFKYYPLTIPESQVLAPQLMACFLFVCLFVCLFVVVVIVVVVWLFICCCCCLFVLFLSC